MIIPKGKELTPAQLTEVTAIAQEFGVRIRPVNGEDATIYAMIGDERDELMLARLAGLSYIDQIKTIQNPYKLMAMNSLKRTAVQVGGVTFGNGHFAIIAGHCTLNPKDPHLFYDTAYELKEIGVDMLRGGVWKPRTSPHSFQGDDRSLDILLEAKRKTGLAIATEVMTSEQVRLTIDAGVDLIWVGARNALNYHLLRQIGEYVESKPNQGALLKRSLHMGSVDEFLAASSYGADGLLVECNINPKRGIGDDPRQAVTPSTLRQIIADAREIHARVQRYKTAK